MSRTRIWIINWILFLTMFFAGISFYSAFAAVYFSGMALLMHWFFNVNFWRGFLNE